MNDDTRSQRWADGATARIEGKPVEQGEDYLTVGWMEMDRWLRWPARHRCAALWLEHRASTLELQAVELLNVGKGVEAEKAQDDGRALEVAAAYIRRELLGESEADGG